ncbi:MAG: 2-oxoacid:acceptor oxidoreductase family protein, partial [Planctomycetota bacterium]
TYVLNVACRAMTKHSLNVHAGHDDYHAIDDTGFFQLFAKDVQEGCDLNLIAHRIAELALNPGICAQDGFLTSHSIETLLLPERELIKEYLGDPSDIIDCPTPAQRLTYGEKRRRIPESYNLDYPNMLGVVQNQDSYAQGVAAQRPFYFDHIQKLADQAMEEYAKLTGRRYQRATGYRLEDAEYVLIGMGSVVPNAEAVCDHLRKARGLKIGVINLTMFRPFPVDVVAGLLKGKKAVTVLERVDQPLAADAPLLKEIRAAMSKGVENGRAKGAVPHAGVPAVSANEMPEFFSGCFGMGSRDLQPNDMIAAVDNMADGGKQKRQYYLGIDFIRKNTKLPKLQIWQEQLLEGYPHLADLALTPADPVNIWPKGAITLRIHSVGGWGAITMGKNVAMTASAVAGLNIKANPKYGSEKKGQPTTFYAVLSKDPIKLNCELKNVTVVLSPDPNVFRHSNPLAGLEDGGVFVIQWDQSPLDLWNSLPRSAQETIQKKKIKVHHLDAFKIAAAEASDAELRYRMQGTAFMGAFFRTSPLMASEGLDRDQLMKGIEAQLKKKFGHLGEGVVKDNLRVIQRGFDELQTLDVASLTADAVDSGSVPTMPADLGSSKAAQGFGNAGRFFEQVCHLYLTGSEGIADPFLALSTIPASTSSIRDMTGVRFEIPKFIPERCTGCGQCWTQCPDSAIPGLVTPVEQLLETAVKFAENGKSLDKMRQLVRPLAKETQKALHAAPPFHQFTDILGLAYKNVIEKMAPAPEKRAALDLEFTPVKTALEDFPLAKTAPFFDLPESREKGAGALLSITVNPQTCKGCLLCVEVCPDGALVTVKQDEDAIDTLRQNWKFWSALPDTDSKYINISSLEEGIGVLPAMLLNKEIYRAMIGGDGACVGCAEKTVLHLVVAAVYALMKPRVAAHLERLNNLRQKLDEKARSLVTSETNLDDVVAAKGGKVNVPLSPEKAELVQRLNASIKALEELNWLYTEGPSGKGRALMGFTNSTGCSSVWASTYPFNPYPFPWVNQLFQDSPSVAIGIFEGHMRKMADGFITLRRAEKLLAGEYEGEQDEAEFRRFNWQQFSNEEFDLCPPIVAVGGDGAMYDIGFQNLSRMLASGKPIRAVVLDTQVYSNTGGQACSSGFTGQVSDMATYGKGQHGKTEVRKEMGLIGLAHRTTYVLQTSQASASHLLGGVLKGLTERRPALFLLHCPCPPEHGIADNQAANAARLALESRAYPFFRYDPDEGDMYSECLSLEGNPEIDENWPSYDLVYMDENNAQQKMTLPLTIADWACTEARFKKHFSAIPAEPEGDLIPFHELLELEPGAREGMLPYIYILDQEQHLQRLGVSQEIVLLAEDRLLYWSQLRQLAGLKVSDTVRATVEAGMEDTFDRKAQEIRQEYEARIAQLKVHYPGVVALRMAEGLLRSGNGNRTVSEI